MAEIKLTKNELKDQQLRLNQLEKYLPTLQLKKALLQVEVNEAKGRIAAIEDLFEERKKDADQLVPLLSTKAFIDPKEAVHVLEVKKHYENIAGVEVPYFEKVLFKPYDYPLFSTPPWVDSAMIQLRELVSLSAETEILEEQLSALEKELREVSIRVNLFEKILIPRALRNIKKIKVFLGDQQLAAVSQAKVAKQKIEERKESRANILME